MKLYLDSNKASNNTYQLDKTISGKWKLINFSFTNNIFNVNDNNNKIYFNENGVDLTATLSNGYYDAGSALTSNISTALNNVATGTITVDFDDTTNKYTITNTLNFYFKFGSSTKNSARKLLGMTASDGTNSTTQTSNNPIDVNTYKNIFINISQNDDKDIFGQNYFSTSFTITGTGTFGELIKYIYKDFSEQYVKLNNTKHITVKIHDLNNDELELNSEYSLILEQMN